MTPAPDRASFEAIALPQLDALYGVALRLTRNDAKAQDLVQDTMLRAYRFWSRFQPGTSVRAWLSTILRNTFINDYHRDGKQRAGAQALAAAVDRVGPQLAGGRISGADAENGPDDYVQDRATKARIDEALTALPEDYRMCVVFADLQGLSYKEIAEVVGCPIGTVMSRLHRGRKLLHKLLYDHAVDAELIPSPTAKPDDNNTVALSRYRAKKKRSQG
ncbi:MAG: sigma-70 family RNA polymerase sigma factor [Myxococcales bacterium FL481]|nr:MAG: sigma-70 family RNA polymerase sigma factor [Myxococcales bacterium FL481]